VKKIRKPKDKKESMFTNEQQAPRKDVERTFGVPQSRCVDVEGHDCLCDHAQYDD
jgi:hypothetical protein